MKYGSFPASVSYLVNLKLLHFVACPIWQISKFSTGSFAKFAYFGLNKPVYTSISLWGVSLGPVWQIGKFSTGLFVKSAYFPLSSAHPSVWSDSVLNGSLCSIPNYSFAQVPTQIDSDL